MATEGVSEGHVERPKMTLNLQTPQSNAMTPLSQEKSFIGDLISFTDRSQIVDRRDVHRRRLSQTSPSKKNRGTIRRSDSLEALNTHRKGSLRRVESEGDITGLVNASDASRMSPTKQRLSPLRRLSAIDTAFGDDVDSSRSRRSSRRDSMLLTLRSDLAKIPCLTALQQRMPKPVEESNEGFSESDTEADESVFTGRSRRRSRLVSYRSGGSVSSYGSQTFELSDAEMRKLRMIQTLNKMGRRASKRMSIDRDAGELAILEASFGMGVRRGSIATRVLMVSKQRNKHKVIQEAMDKRKAIPSGDTPPLRTQSQIEREEQQEAQKEKSKKIFDMLKKQTRGSTGGQKEGPTKEESAKNLMQGFRRKFRRKRMKPLDRWRRKARFLIILLRAWKIHSNAINEVLVDNNDSLDMITRGQNDDLMFDITEYGATKEAKVSIEAKRILQKKQITRTEDEKHYIQVFLRNYKSIAEYPVKMQKLIATRSWFESYDIKRVIVREGHVPMCFYFVLSGSAIVSAMDNGGSSRTIMFLNRGDSFGDVAILNKSRRETTVISREKLELLCMTDEDFTDIFMSGGLRDPNDPFLSSIQFLEGWPREMLLENPKKCIFSYFKRGTVLVNDSSNSEWIFVVKSGSVSVLKKLQNVNAKKPKPKHKQIQDFRDEVLGDMKEEQLLSHQEQLTLMHEEEMRGLEGVGLHTRFYALPEINIRTNESYNELKTMKEEFANANSVNRALSHMAESGIDIRPDTGSTAVDMASVKREKQKNRRKSVVNAVNALKGLSDMLFGSNATLSLVSNGSECIMIDKKFYQENASQSLIVHMKEVTYPYPSNEDLQDNLEAQMRWDIHRKNTLHSQLKDMKIKKSDKSDARALINITREVANSDYVRT